VSQGVVEVRVDRYVGADHGSAETVVTFALGTVVETPEDALRLCALAVLEAVDGPPANRAERRRKGR